ncbi:very-long-chain 3-oxoacyl-CoA reductase-like protein At1g24470 [Impatiens glandulifera]|uniref:very-long-chain 3-oxoacyl-CoA reductase-like protein At1g24470 n=1 Tax=Impatiens glandulifera TaxID=253017 RepID=UPI001FB0F169|nr:very-long-chain 3-oxoacyl-CoA reductase-like protein At1g24470 [Impatiens glandulifera]
MIKEQPLWILIPAIIGFLRLSNYILTFVIWVFITFIRKPKNLIKNYGSWALVTGSTDGIGKSMAIQLAEQGLNLVLVSRDLGKLKLVSELILGKYKNTQIRCVAVDLSGAGEGVIAAVEAAVMGIDLGVVVNNAGVTYEEARYFDEVEEREWMNVVKVNLEGTTRVTKVVLKGMMERKRGAIVNVGSGAAIVVPSHPLFAVYAATKAYIDKFSSSLHMEYKEFGIHVQCQVPLYVSTKMAAKVAFLKGNPTMFVPSSDDYARAAIRRIGYESRCTPYWTHSFQWFLVSLLPEFVIDAWRLSIGIQRREKGRRHRSHNRLHSTS